MQQKMKKSSKLSCKLENLSRGSCKQKQDVKPFQNVISGAVGIKLPDENIAETQPKRWCNSAKTFGSDRKPSKSPNRHRIQVYDATYKKQEQVSPYLCEVVKWPKEHPPLTQTYQEMFVSDREYQLLQRAFNLQPLPPRSRQVRKFQKTLFGYVSLPSPNLDSKKSKILSKKSTFLEVASKRRSSKSRKDLSSRRQEGSLKEGNTSQTDTDENGTNANQDTLESKHQPAKLVESSVSPTTLASTSLASTQTNGNLDENIETFIKSLHLHSTITSSSSHEILDSSKVKIPEDLMKSSIFVASETCMILMNTLFRDALEDPNSSNILNASTEFQQFVNSTNETQALETAGIIFDTAGKMINNFLNQVQDTFESPPTPLSPTSPLEVEDDEDLEDILTDADSLTSKSSQLEEIETSTLTDIKSRVENAKTNDVTLNILNQDNDLSKFHMKLTFTSNMGLLLQSITSNNHEFKLNFIGSPTEINSLLSSSRSKSCQVILNPTQLLELTERSSSYVINQFLAAKYSFLLCYDKSTTIIRQCLAGKHGYCSKSLKRAELKLRGLNTFAGVVNQMCISLTDLFEKLFIALDFVMQLENFLQCPRVQNNQSKNRPFTYSLELMEGVTGMGSMEQLLLFLNDIDSVLEIGKNSLLGIQLKNPEVKMKKSLKEIIKILFEAVIQLDNKNNVDLGTLFVSMVCNVNFILSSDDLVENLPMVDVKVRKQLMSSLNQLDDTLRDIYELLKKMSILASHLSTKSIQKLKKNKELAKALADKDKLNTSTHVPWYRRRLFHPRPQRTYSLISVPSPEKKERSQGQQDECLVLLRRRVESACEFSTPVLLCQDKKDE